MSVSTVYISYILHYFFGVHLSSSETDTLMIAQQGSVGIYAGRQSAACKRCRDLFRCWRVCIVFTAWLEGLCGPIRFQVLRASSVITVKTWFHHICQGNCPLKWSESAEILKIANSVRGATVSPLRNFLFVFRKHWSVNLLTTPESLCYFWLLPVKLSK